MTLAFKRIDNDLEQWEKIVVSFEDHTIFQTPAWLSFLAKTQKAEPIIAVLDEGKQRLGFFTGLVVKKLGIRILGSPLPGWTTSYMGLNLLPSIPRRLAVEALLVFAFEQMKCAHLEVLDRNLRIEDVESLGFEYSFHKGYEIDLTQSEDELLGQMTNSCRRCIRKAQKSGVTIEEAHDLEFADEYYGQLQDVFRKQALVPTYQVDRVRELIRHLYPTGHLLLLRAKAPDGRCIATGIFPAMNGTVYFWGGASWRRFQYLRPNEAIHWYAMQYWKQRGMGRYDMGGGGEYKRKFGGDEITVPWIRKSRYASIMSMRELAKQMANWRQHVLGQAECVISKFDMI